MRKTAGDAGSKPILESGCVHHWIIESPEGAVSKGICKMCGAVNEFSNSLALPTWVETKNSSYSDAADLLEDIGIRSDRAG